MFLRSANRFTEEFENISVRIIKSELMALNSDHFDQKHKQENPKRAIVRYNRLNEAKETKKKTIFFRSFLFFT